MTLEENNAEFQAFTALYYKLRIGIESDIAYVVDQAFSRGLIPDGVKSEATSRLVNLTEAERARIILNAVQKRINNDPGAYEEFAVILDGIPAFMPLADQMRRELSKYKMCLGRNKRKSASGNCSCKVIRKESLQLVALFLVLLGSAFYIIVCPSNPALEPKMNLSADKSNELRRFEIPIQHNLPGASSPFFGRKKDLEELTSLLESRPALVININGPPAFGKSTLAIQVGYELMKHQSIRTVRYVDTETTKQSWFFCTHNSYANDLPQNEDRTNALSIDHLESVPDPNYSREPNLCEWSKQLKQRSVLILDNCDHILQGAKRKTFTSFIRNHLKQLPVQKLSIIITSQERMEFTDIAFISRPLQELTPNDSIALLQHYVPDLVEMHAFNLSAIVGHCPLALKVIGKLLAKRGVQNFGTLFSELEKHVVGTISDPITDHKEKFRSIMDVAYLHLDNSTKNCCQIMSFFPGSFDSETGRQVMQSLVDTDCIQDVILKSLAEKSFTSDIVRYSMHKIIRDYFTERFGGNLDSLLLNLKFKSQFADYYSQHLITMMRNLHHGNRTEEEYYALFYLEAHNIEFFTKYIISFSFFDVMDEATSMLALGLLVHENLTETVTSKHILEKTLHSYLNETIFAKLCSISNLQICGSIYWKTIVDMYILDECTQLASIPFTLRLSLLYYSELEYSKICSSVFNCKTLAPFRNFPDIFTLIQRKVDMTSDHNEKLLFSDVHTAIILCDHNWLRSFLIMFAKSGLIMQIMINFFNQYGADAIGIFGILFSVLCTFVLRCGLGNIMLHLFLQVALIILLDFIETALIVKCINTGSCAALNLDDLDLLHALITIICGVVSLAILLYSVFMVLNRGKHVTFTCTPLIKTVLINYFTAFVYITNKSSLVVYELDYNLFHLHILCSFCIEIFTISYVSHKKSTLSKRRHKQKSNTLKQDKANIHLDIKEPVIIFTIIIVIASLIVFRGFSFVVWLLSFYKTESISRKEMMSV